MYNFANTNKLSCYFLDLTLITLTHTNILFVYDKFNLIIHFSLIAP